MIVDIIDKNINHTNHTDIILNVESPNEEYRAILFSHSTVTTKYRMGISILPKNIYEKIEKDNRYDKYDILFQDKYNILLLTSIYNDNTIIQWNDDNKLIINCNALNKAEVEKIDYQSIDCKKNKYKDIDIEYK